MIWWPWAVLAFGAGLAAGALAMLVCVMDMKLRADDARVQGRWPPL